MSDFPCGQACWLRVKNFLNGRDYEDTEKRRLVHAQAPSRHTHNMQTNRMQALVFFFFLPQHGYGTKTGCLVSRRRCGHAARDG